MQCRNGCGHEIHFDKDVKSSSGKSIPLEGATGYDKHDCPKNPFKKLVEASKPFERTDIVSNQTIFESVKETNELLKKEIELIEALLRKLGLFTTGDKVENQKGLDAVKEGET